MAYSTVCSWQIGWSFTSANGLPHLLRQVEALGGDIRALGAARIAAIGSATADSLRDAGLRVDFVPTRFVAESVVEEFPNPADRRILIAQADIARDALPRLLAARGAQPDVIPVYRTVADMPALPDLSTIDVATFTSSSTVRQFRANYPGDVRGPVIACIGPLTAQTAHEMGLDATIEANPHTISGLVRALEAYFAGRQHGITLPNT